MELHEKQLEMCTASRWDFSDLRAIFLNCTLKKSPEMSHTEGLWQICKAIFEKNGVQVDELRIIDHQVAFGVWGDTTEHGYQRDDWPQIYTRVKAATIVVIGSSIWLGEKTSVCTMLIERLYANSHLLNEHGQYADYGKVDGCLITGNEDGAKHCSMNILYSLSHLGYVIPPQADSGWLGPVGPGPSYLDPGSGGPERLHQPQHDVHDVEPHAPRPHDQGHWRHPGPRQPTVEVGCGMSLRLSQPRAPLAVFVHILLDPVVVVPHAVEREVVLAPDRLDAHPRTRCVEVWLEGDHLGVLLEHGKRMEFLTGSTRHDVDVDTVCPSRGRTAAWRPSGPGWRSAT